MEKEREITITEYFCDVCETGPLGFMYTMTLANGQQLTFCTEHFPALKKKK